MFDALALALLLGLCRSVRSRFRPGILGGLAIACLLVADAAGALAAPRSALPVFYTFVLIFLGPSAWPFRAHSPLPMVAWFLQAPSIIRGTRILLAVGIVALADLQSSRMRPETPRAYALDELSQPYVLFAVLELLLLVIVTLVHVLEAEG